MNFVNQSTFAKVILTYLANKLFGILFLRQHIFRCCSNVVNFWRVVALRLAGCLRDSDSCMNRHFDFVHNSVVFVSDICRWLLSDFLLHCMYSFIVSVGFIQTYSYESYETQMKEVTCI